MNQTSTTSSTPHILNGCFQMVKTLPISQEDATNLRMVEDDAKIATKNAVGESFVTVQQLHCTSVLTILSMTAKREIFCNKLGELAKNMRCKLQHTKDEKTR